MSNHTTPKSYMTHPKMQDSIDNVLLKITEYQDWQNDYWALEGNQKTLVWWHFIENHISKNNYQHIVSLLNDSNNLLNDNTLNHKEIMMGAINFALIDVVIAICPNILPANHNDNVFIRYCCAINQNEKILQYLLQHGADAKRLGLIPSMMVNGNANTLAIIELLISYGADPKLEETEIFRKIGHLSKKTFKKILKFFVDFGLDINVNNAVIFKYHIYDFCDSKMLSILLDYGANPSLLSQKVIDYTFIHCQDPQIILRFIEMGVDFSKCRRHQMDIKEVEAVNALVAQGIDLHWLAARSFFHHYD